MTVNSRTRGRTLVALFALALPFLPTALYAQTVPWFEVQVAGPGEAPVVLSSVQELAVDDIVFDYREVDRPPAGAPADLAAAQRDGYRLYSPGQAHWGNAKLTLAPGPDTDWLYQWWGEAAKGKNIRKNISVTLFKSDKTPGRAYNFFDCFPVRWKAPELNSGDGVQTETLTVKIGRIEFVTSVKPSPGTGGVSVTLGDGNGGSITDTWESWGGGEPMQILTQPIGNAPWRTNSPGHKTVGEITLRASVWLSKKGYDYYLTRALAGEDPWISGPNGTETSELLFRLRKRPELLYSAADKTYTYHDCFPVRYVFPRMSVTNTTGNVMEEVSVKPIRVELK